LEAANALSELARFKGTNLGLYFIEIASKYKTKGDLDSSIFFLKKGIKYTYTSYSPKSTSNNFFADRNPGDRKICIEELMQIFFQLGEYDSVLKYYDSLFSDPVIREEINRNFEYINNHPPGSFIAATVDGILYPVGMSLIKKNKFEEGEKYLNMFLNDYATLFDTFYSDPLTKTKLEDPWFILAKHYITVGDLSRATILIEQSLEFLKKRVHNKNIELAKEILERETILSTIQ
jgi:tetratricopeptide (TPR) repeat protein